MTKSRIALLLFVVVSSLLLYELPRYVVNNAERGIDKTASDEHQESVATAVESGHVVQIPDSVASIIDDFYESFANAENREKRIIFADSLAKAFKTVGKLDSLAKYLEVRAIENPSLENFIIAGDGYYNAFNFAVGQKKQNYLAQKAREYYSRVLEENSSLNDIKSKLAMTYVAGSNPMLGVTMLREVLEEDPNNELAIYNLGMLSITSGQLDKAMERFETLTRLDPENPEANFYLGYCLLELGKAEDAKQFFEKVVSLGISGDLMDASKEYLKKINK